MNTGGWPSRRNPSHKVKIRSVDGTRESKRRTKWITHGYHNYLIYNNESYCQKWSVFLKRVRSFKYLNSLKIVQNVFKMHTEFPMVWQNSPPPTHPHTRPCAQWLGQFLHSQSISAPCFWKWFPCQGVKTTVIVSVLRCVNYILFIYFCQTMQSMALFVIVIHF